MSRTTDRKPDAGSANSPETEGGFRRWSRRKHEARIALRREKTSSDAVAEPAPAETVPDRVLTDADMPPIDSLNEQSDFSPFMSPGVSDALRQAALRRLFRSPQMNVLCELEGEFFDARGYTPLGNIVTHEMRAALEREMEKAKAAAQEKLGDALDSPSTGVVEPAPAADISEKLEPAKMTKNEPDRKGDA
jgi:hypothetical protein